MNAYLRMARAMEIFAEYEDDAAEISAEHDEMWAGPDPAVVSAEHKAELAGIGWKPDDACFHRFV